VQQPHFFATAIRATRAVSVCVFSAVTAVTAVTVVGGSVWSVSSFAQEQSPEQAIAVQASPIDELSDEQLTNLAADWEQLDAAARADLIAETRDRMQPGQAQTPQPRASAASSAIRSQNTSVPQVTVRTERRRYGRVVRQADGSLVRIETQVVRVQRSDPKRAFGVGFERRRERQHDPATTGQESVQGESMPTTTSRQDVLVVSETLD